MGVDDDVVGDANHGRQLGFENEQSVLVSAEVYQALQATWSCSEPPYPVEMVMVRVHGVDST